SILPMLTEAALLRLVTRIRRDRNMARTLPHRSRPGMAFLKSLVLGTLLVCLGLAARAEAQPLPTPTQTGSPPALPLVPDRIPRTMEGPEGVSSFIDSLSTNDAA